jgi:hypothetical protein
LSYEVPPRLICQPELNQLACTIGGDEAVCDHYTTDAIVI